MAHTFYCCVCVSVLIGLEMQNGRSGSPMKFERVHV
jgi:hypothetical protein